MKSFIYLLLVAAACLLSAILSIAIPVAVPVTPKKWLGQPEEIDYVSLGKQLVAKYKGLDEKSTEELDERIGFLYRILRKQSSPTIQTSQDDTIWAQDVAEFATLLQLRHAQPTRSTSAMINTATQLFHRLKIPEQGNLRGYLNGLTIPNVRSSWIPGMGWR